MLRPRFSRSSRRCRAFSLVEVLLALALLSILLVALNQFIFSMGELWGKNRQQRLFDQHVRAVTRYVGDVLARASLAPKKDREVRMVESKLSTLGGAMLTFELPDGDRMLPWPESPLPDVQCMLTSESGRGLLLHWQSRWETTFETAPPRTLVLSPLVTGVEFDYYREETQTWQTQATPMPDKNGRWILPTRVRLHFQYDRYKANTLVPVPAPSQALPTF